MPRTYSDKTRAMLADFLDRQFNHAELSRLFLYASVPDRPSLKRNKLSRSVDTIRYLSHVNEFTGDMEHADQLDALFDETVKQARNVFDSPDNSEMLANEQADGLRRALRADGYEIIDGQIVESDELVLDVTSEISILSQKLQKHTMPDVIKTLDQAHQDFIDGNHEACNAMLRTSLEGTLLNIAIKIAGSKESIPVQNKKYGPKPSDVRKYLNDEGFFQNDEINFIKEFYGYASTNGSHPGMSNESETRLRRLMIVALIQYSLEKLESIN